MISRVQKGHRSIYLQRHQNRLYHRLDLSHTPVKEWGIETVQRDDVVLFGRVMKSTVWKSGEKYGVGEVKVR